MDLLPHFMVMGEALQGLRNDPGDDMLGHKRELGVGLLYYLYHCVDAPTIHVF